MLDGDALDKTAPTVKSPSKGERTRTRILDEAFGRVVEKGFAATSIEELVEAAGITKGGFFYHFKDKNDLARQLLERYLEETETVMDSLEARARELSDDPLHSFLIFLKLYAEMMQNMLAIYPGCLVSAITYQDRSFDPEVRRINTEGVLAWRRRFERWLSEIAATYPPKFEIDITDLADQMSVTADGSIIIAKALRDPLLLSRQADLYRKMVRLLFVD